jgi:2-haloacid dehalogenase
VGFIQKKSYKGALMKSTRRMFSSTLIAGGLFATAQESLGRPDEYVKAVAFDAFPVLDPRPVFALAENLFPGKGADLAAVWRTRQFEYTWLRTLSHRYADFWQVTEDALVFAANMLKLNLTGNQRVRLMDAYLTIRCWPDAPTALRSLKDKGIRLAFLSNMTPEMLEAGIRNSGVEQVFDHVLSTDRVAAYKPDPRAYQMGIDAFGLKREEILFAAFAGWDAAGAKAFGYPTFWVNRQNQPAEELAVKADNVGATLDDLVRYIAR